MKHTADICDLCHGEGIVTLAEFSYSMTAGGKTYHHAACGDHAVEIADEALTARHGVTKPVLDHDLNRLPL